MRLSEAIREGATLRPKAEDDFFIFYRFSTKADDIRSCALGAAYEAVCGFAGISFFFGDDCLSLESLQKIDAALYERWPVLRGAWCRKPVDEEGEEGAITLQEIIQEMNDYGEYTREEIADWLESVGE